MRKCDRYWRRMELKAVRDALRVLRVHSGKGVRGIPGLDKSTVHRIENTKKEPDYSPELSSVAIMVEGCGWTLARFFADYEKFIAAEPDAASLLALLREGQNAAQVRQFLGLSAEIRQLILVTAPRQATRTADQAQSPSRGPKLATTRVRRTKSEPAPHRRSGPRKTGT